MSTFRCRQTKPEINILFCSLSGSQLMWQLYLYLLGPTWKIRYRIRCQNFYGIAWVLYFDFFFGRFLARILHRPLKLKCIRIWRILTSVIHYWYRDLYIEPDCLWKTQDKVFFSLTTGQSMVHCELAYRHYLCSYYFPCLLSCSQIPSEKGEGRLLENNIVWKNSYPYFLSNCTLGVI